MNHWIKKKENCFMNSTCFCVRWDSAWALWIAVRVWDFYEWKMWLFFGRTSTGLWAVWPSRARDEIFVKVALSSWALTTAAPWSGRHGGRLCRAAFALPLPHRRSCFGLQVSESGQWLNSFDNHFVSQIIQWLQDPRASKDPREDPRRCSFNQQDFMYLLKLF